VASSVAIARRTAPAWLPEALTAWQGLLPLGLRSFGGVRFVRIGQARGFVPFVGASITTAGRYLRNVVVTEISGAMLTRCRRRYENFCGQPKSGDRGLINETLLTTSQHVFHNCGAILRSIFLDNDFSQAVTNLGVFIFQTSRAHRTGRTRQRRRLKLYRRGRGVAVLCGGSASAAIP
jgi:hypothetical protein